MEIWENQRLLLDEKENYFIGSGLWKYILQFPFKALYPMFGEEQSESMGAMILQIAT